MIVDQTVVVWDAADLLFRDTQCRKARKDVSDSPIPPSPRAHA